MIPQHAIILTQSVVRVLKNKRLSLEVVTDYSQMRALFSQNDLAAILALQTSALTQSIHDSFYYALVDKWRSSAKEHVQELDSVLLPLSQSELVANYLREQLSLPEGKDLDPAASPVQVVDLNGSGIAVVLDVGAIQYLADGANKYTVVRAVMQVFLKYMPLDKLASQEWFRRLVHLSAVYSTLRPPQPVIS